MPAWTGEQRAEPYRAALCKRLSETLLPGLEDQIATSLLMTPQDFQDRLHAYKGAAFAMEPVLTQSAWFRPHNRSEEVDRLYLVGAGTHPGAGLPGVLSSARVLDSVVPHGRLAGLLRPGRPCFTARPRSGPCPCTSRHGMKARIVGR